MNKHKQLVKRLKNEDGRDINQYLGKYLGSGADGRVYEYTKTRVIKICWESNQHNIQYLDFNNTYDPLVKIIDKAKDIRSFVKIYSHGKLYRDNAKRESGYYLIMEKLDTLNWQEREDIGDTHRIGIGKGDKRGCGQSKKKCTCMKCLSTKIIKGIREMNKATGKFHNDLHNKNIMKNKFGKLKIIDLEGFLYQCR